MKSPYALDRAGICSACDCLVQQHYSPFTNVFRGCAYALRINEQFRRANAEAPAPVAKPEASTQAAGEQLLREGRF